jgi:anti-sigma B factor antagonist
MKIESENKGGVTVLRLHGKMMGGPADSGALGGHVNAAIERGGAKLLLDLGGLTLVNSTGLGILVTNHTRIRRADGVLKIVNIPDRIGAAFQMTWLDKVFDLYEDEAKALASFQ